MHAILNSASPVFALILAGFACGYLGMFDRAATDSLNRFAVYLALPSLMFATMSKITHLQVGLFGFAGAFCGGFSFCFAVAFAISRCRGRRIASASIEGLNAGYGNVGFMGIPMCLLVFGPESVPPSIIATLLTATVLFFFAIVILEIELQHEQNAWATGCRAIGSVFRNPLFIGPTTGLAAGLSGLKVPAPIESFTTLLGGAASPAALVCIGLFLAQERIMGEDATSIAILVSLKLIVQPAVTALLAFHVFSMPPLWAHSAVILSALPIGSGPFTIAKLYGLEARTTSGAIVASHVFAVFTVSLLIGSLTGN